MKQHHATAARLAAAFVAGPWHEETLLERAAVIFGKRSRWMRPLVRRVLGAFAYGPRPRTAVLAEFLHHDAGFRRASRREAESEAFAQPQFVPNLVPLMLPAPGGPQAWRVPDLVSPRALAAWLGVSLRQLDWFADRQGRERHHARGPLQHYHYRWVPKRAGGARLVESPKPRLKALQTRVLRGVLDPIPPHDAVHGFRPGRSIYSFVAPHVNRKIVLRMDLAHFFASVSATQVVSIFMTAGYPESVAVLLTGLCTNRFPHEVLAAGAEANRRAPRFDTERRYRGWHLPQGAPTSPALANLSAFRLDCRLAALAAAAGGTYTRYADDLAFSGDADFARGAERFARHAAATIHESGFSVNHRKTRLMRPGARQQLTGLVINCKTNLRRTDYDRLKAILHNCLKHGPASQNRTGHPNFQAHLAGRIAHLAQANPDRARKLRGMFERIAF